MLSRKLVVLAAASLVLGSSAAVAQSAPSAALNAPAVERAGAEVSDAGELRGTTGWIIGAIAIGLLIWGALELFDDDEPESP